MSAKVQKVTNIFIERKVSEVAKSNLRMTLEDVCQAFREMGIPMEKGRLADDIAAGVYPFGRVAKVAPNGRRTFDIWRVDVEQFLRSRIPTGI